MIMPMDPKPPRPQSPPPTQPQRPNQPRPKYDHTVYTVGPLLDLAPRHPEIFLYRILMSFTASIVISLHMVFWV